MDPTSLSDSLHFLVAIILIPSTETISTSQNTTLHELISDRHDLNSCRHSWIIPYFIQQLY